MKIVSVKFANYGKEYAYYTDKSLVVGGVYEIIADGTTKYDSPVTVVGYLNSAPKGIALRTITSVKVISMPPKPESDIKDVIYNEAKRTTVVIWKDGMKTIVKCQEGDFFDKEIGLAMAFMKRCYGNRGCFNDDLKKWAW